MHDRHASLSEAHPFRIHPIQVGVFERLTDAQLALERLARAGYRTDQVSLICPQCEPADGLGLEEPESPSEHAARGALGGGGVGAFLGGLVALIGITTTGGAPLLAAGAVALGAGGGAVAGGLVGAMLGRGADEDVGDFYDQSLERGKILVAVENASPARLEEARTLLAESGAQLRETES